MKKVTQKIALHLSPEADADTRQRFYMAIDQLNEMLKAGMQVKNRDEEIRLEIGAVDSQGALDSVAWILVYGTEHISTCKMLAKLMLERHTVGDKYEIIVNPKPTLK